MAYPFKLPADLMLQIVFSTFKLLPMKRLLFGFLAVLGITFTSCEKCSTCTCESTYTFEFSENIDASTQNVLETAYTNEFNEDYPELSEEICTKRGQHNDSIAAFEAKSYQVYEENQFQGYEWTVDFDRVCTCTDD